MRISSFMRAKWSASVNWFMPFKSSFIFPHFSCCSLSFTSHQSCLPLATTRFKLKDKIIKRQQHGNANSFHCIVGLMSLHKDFKKSRSFSSSTWIRRYWRKIRELLVHQKNQPHVMHIRSSPGTWSIKLNWSTKYSPLVFHHFNRITKLIRRPKIWHTPRN
jgi:hypothetical protein